MSQQTGVVLDAEITEAEHTNALSGAAHIVLGGGDGMDLGRP